MNIQIHCEATLSKKLEKIAEFGEPIEFRLGPVRGNKADAYIRIVTKNGVSIDEIAKMGITSIEFKVQDAGEEAPTVQNDSRPVSTLFSSNAQIVPGDALPIAVPLPAKSANPAITKTAQQVTTNAPIPKNVMDAPVLVTPPVTQTSVAIQPIMSYAELMDVLMATTGIDQSIPAPKAKSADGRLTRKEAQDYEEQIKNLPKIIRPVYIGNMTGGTIIINDLNQAIKLNEIIDFSRLPARRLVDSRELRGLLLQNRLKFFSEAEYMTYLNTMDSVSGGHPTQSLPTGSREEMEAFMQTGTIPPEIANKKSAKAIGITHETREMEEIDLSQDGGTDMDIELETFNTIAEEKPKASTQRVSSEIKKSSSVKTIRRSSKED